MMMIEVDGLIGGGRAMLKFNTVLREAAIEPAKFDPEKVFLLRHEDKRVKGGVYQAWKSRRQDFETYQNGQTWENRFKVGSSIASFVVGPDRETLFVGLYDVLTVAPRNERFTDPLLGPMEAGEGSIHETRRSERMRDYEEKLVIDWGAGTRSWRQRAHLQDKTVLEIRAQANEPHFPRYVDLHRRLSDFANIYPSWQKQLAAAKGVYLLTFDDGMQYVGSATGQEGFWQRWQDYINTGHGGNVVLRRDNRDAKEAMVSILEVSGSAATDIEIIKREMRWQEKLGTRAKRLDELPASAST
jgi:hypothetical protein